MALPISSDHPTLEAELQRQSGPLYRRVAGALRHAIESGQYEPGALLPAERRLAESLRVSRVTVVAAYETLRQEGIVERRRGSGTRVVQRPPGADPWVGTSIRQLMGHGAIPGEYLDEATDGIGFTIAALPGARRVAEAAAATAAEELPSLLADFGYAPYGYAPLRRALAERHSAEGVSTSPDQILVTSGAQQALSLLATLLAGPGATALVEDPTYAGMLDALRAVGATPMGVPVDAGGVQVAPMAQLAMRVAPRFIYVIPSYHNPTGVVLSATRAEEIGRLAARFHIPLIDDRSLSGLGWGDGPLPPMLTNVSPGPVVTVGSLSKLTWGGLRIGWIRGPEALIDQLARLKLAVDHGGSMVSQVIAARLLPQLDDLAEERRRLATERYEVLADSLRRNLPTWSFTRPAGGLSVWVRAPGMVATAFAGLARRHGAIVVPGPVFSASGQHHDRLRLTFGDEPGTIEAGVRALAEAWTEWEERRDTTRPSLDVVI